MRNPALILRLPPKLLKTLQQEATANEESVQQLIRRLLRARSVRKKQQGLAYGFAGPARRHIRDYVDNFAGPPGSAGR